MTSARLRQRTGAICVIAFAALALLGGSPTAFAGKLEGWLAIRSGYYETAFRELLPLAERGDAECQYEIGLMYRMGQGVAQDNAAAFMWYSRAAEQEHPGGANGLGAMYQAGAGVEQNHALARKWFLRAAEADYHDAILNLGRLYDYGVGVSPDPVEALRWYKIAANSQDPYAQWAIGNIYWVGGRGIPRDVVEARKWLQLAADQGYAPAQADIALMYDRGDGIPVDYRLACFWSSIAVPHLKRKSYIVAASRLQEKSCGRLSAEDRQSVIEMQAEWKADDVWGRRNKARFAEKLRKLREQGSPIETSSD